MKESDLLISNREDGICVKATGRANFEYAVPLRELIKSTDSFPAFRIDLGPCEAMDSTFMGVLTMIALKARKINVTAEIFNASAGLQKALRDLGVAKLFRFENGEVFSGDGRTPPAGGSMLAAAETVTEAHKTLVEADSDNEAKFRTVIEFAEQDVKRLKKE